MIYLYDFSSKRIRRYIIATSSAAPASQVHLKIFHQGETVYRTYVYIYRILSLEFLHLTRYDDHLVNPLRKALYKSHPVHHQAYIDEIVFSLPHHSYSRNCVQPLWLKIHRAQVLKLLHKRLLYYIRYVKFRIWEP